MTAIAALKLRCYAHLRLWRAPFNLFLTAYAGETVTGGIPCVLVLSAPAACALYKTLNGARDRHYRAQSSLLCALVAVARTIQLVLKGIFWRKCGSRYVGSSMRACFVCASERSL